MNKKKKHDKESKPAGRAAGAGRAEVANCGGLRFRSQRTTAISTKNAKIGINWVVSRIVYLEKIWYIIK